MYINNYSYSENLSFLDTYDKNNKNLAKDTAEVSEELPKIKQQEISFAKEECYRNPLPNDLLFEMMGYLRPLEKKAVARTCQSFYKNASRSIECLKEQEKCDFYKINFLEDRPVWLEKRFVSIFDGAVIDNAEMVESCLQNISIRSLNNIEISNSKTIEEKIIKERTDRIILLFSHVKFTTHPSHTPNVSFTTRQPRARLPGITTTSSLKCLKEQALMGQGFNKQNNDTSAFDSLKTYTHRCTFGWLTKDNQIIGRYADGKHMIQNGKIFGGSTNLGPRVFIAMILCDYKIEFPMSKLMASHEPFYNLEDIMAVLKEYGLKINAFKFDSLSLDELKEISNQGSVYLHSGIENCILDKVDDQIVTLRVAKNGYRIDIPVDTFLQKIKEKLSSGHTLTGFRL